MANGSDPNSQYDPTTQPALDVGGQVHPLILQAIRDRLVGAASAAIQPFKPAVQEAANVIGYPGQVFQAGMAGQTPSPAEMVPWSTQTALGMIGGGSPFAQAGALGSAGGRALAAVPVVEEAAAPAGIRAYHSSPYDFGSFDIGKVGAGQGAQAYGHGLYFAENPKVSGQGGEYWEEFSHQFKGPEGMAMRQLQAANFDRAKAIEASAKNLADNRAFLAQEISEQWPNLTPTNARKYLENLTADRQAAHDLLVSGQPVGPRTYEVNIRADPEHFLDWDKPLNEQSPHVQDALKNLGFDPADKVRTGEGIVRLMQRNAGPQGATSNLRDAGISGIRYLDAGSRNAGQVGLETKYRAAGDLESSNATHERFFATRFRENGGDLDRTVQALRNDAARFPEDQTVKKTLDFAQDPNNKFTFNQGPQTHNLVVFNDKLIDIAKKYGLAGLIAGGAYHAQLPAPEATGK